MTAQSRPEPSVQLTRMDGSPVVGQYKSKRERVQEAMLDLRLTGYGCMARIPGQTIKPALLVPAFARACSLFLRKVAVDENRLLDADTCKVGDLQFGRLKKIPVQRHVLTAASLDVLESEVKIRFVPKDDPETVEDVNFSGGPLHFEITVEWPLPGMADFTRQPTPESPWRLGKGRLFDLELNPLSTCDTWLGQQLVMFDDYGISLRDIVKVTADTEAAHSVDASVLTQPPGERKRRVVQNRNVHILSNILVGGVQYNHAVVIESAMHLFRVLERAGFVDDLATEIDMPGITITISEADLFASDQTWLRFAGGHQWHVGSDSLQVTSHHIRAPGGRRVV